MTKKSWVFFLPTIHLQHWTNEGNAFLDHIHLTLSYNRMLNGMPQCHWRRTLHTTVRVLCKSCMQCSSAKMDLAIPSRANWYNSHWLILLHSTAG
jgi:hypothetical protein